MIRHVLLDADGVVQDLPGGWQAALAPWVPEPEALFARLAADEEACIRGEGPFMPVLARHLQALGVNAAAHDVYDAVWSSIEAVPAVLGLVERLRNAGVGVHLVTNQNPERAAYMREHLGYDAVFDSAYYSCEIGLAKPDLAFFEHVLSDLGAPGEQVLFIDDSLRNVEGARVAGVAAEHWHHRTGTPALVDLLVGHGISA